MKNLKTSEFNDLLTTKVRLSRTSSRLQKWKHQDFDRLPELTYQYNDEDIKFVGKEDKLIEFAKTFWDKKENESKSFQGQYEFDLRQGVLKLISELHNKYQSIFSSEIEKEFK